MSNDFDDVGRFHTKFGLPSVTDEGPYPREVTPELLEFRIKFLLEELIEFCDAVNYKITIEPTGHLKLMKLSQFDPSIDHGQAFDALIDLVYVALGTAHLLGYPWHQGWAAVQHANMQKVRARKDGSDSKRGSSFDVVKPYGWMPPDIAGLLRECGWSNDNKEIPQ